MNQPPIKALLDDFCKNNPDGVQVVLVFRTGVVSGALRFARKKSTGEAWPDLYELAAPSQVQDGPGSPPREALVSNFFSADAVERILVMGDMPRVVTPKNSGGLFIPS